MVGALEAIKMNSPCPRDTGLEIVARCSLLVTRLLEGRIIQQSKIAGEFFFNSQTEGGERTIASPFHLFLGSFLIFRVERIHF